MSTRVRPELLVKDGRRCDCFYMSRIRGYHLRQYDRVLGIPSETCRKPAMWMRLKERPSIRVIDLCNVILRVWMVVHVKWWRATELVENTDFRKWCEPLPKLRMTYQWSVLPMQLLIWRDGHLGQRTGRDCWNAAVPAKCAHASEARIYCAEH